MNRTQETHLLAEKILVPIGQAADQLPEQPIIGFMSMVGRAYARELMVVGRALNGWDVDSKLPSEPWARFSLSIPFSFVLWVGLIAGQCTACITRLFANHFTSLNVGPEKCCTYPV